MPPTRARGAVLALALAVPCAAQQQPTHAAGPTWARAAEGHRWTWSPTGMAEQLREASGASPVGAGLASLVLPGAGQHRLGQGRKWVYLGLEAAAWAVHLERRDRGSDLRDRYRDLAWEEARSAFQGSERVDGDFAYYETLSRWARSGAYDLDAAAAGVQPEDDPQVYNGFIWERARAIFFPAGQPVTEGDPAYGLALEYYQGNAYDSDFLWDWSANPQAQAELSDLIGRSDDRFGEARTAVGVALLNHFVSAIDAYVSARSGRAAPARLRFAPPLHGRGVRLLVQVSGLR